VAPYPVLFLGALAACGGGQFEERECGQPGELFDIAFASDIDELAGCTTLAGSLRFGDSQFTEIDGLESMRVIEGTVNFFRNPNLVDLSGLRNLEVVGEHLFVHHNDALTTLSGLPRLRRVRGDLTIISNSSLPQLDAEAFADELEVSGEVNVLGNQ
jgi:hypothetical protein